MNPPLPARIRQESAGARPAAGLVLASEGATAPECMQEMPAQNRHATQTHNRYPSPIRRPWNPHPGPPPCFWRAVGRKSALPRHGAADSAGHSGKGYRLTGSFPLIPWHTGNKKGSSKWLSDRSRHSSLQGPFSPRVAKPTSSAASPARPSAAWAHRSSARIPSRAPSWVARRVSSATTSRQISAGKTPTRRPIPDERTTRPSAARTRSGRPFCLDRPDAHMKTPKGPACSRRS